MNPLRGVSALLLGASAFFYLGVLLPGRARLAVAEDEYRRARVQRHEAQTRLARLQRREAVRGRAVSVLASAGAPKGDAVSALRRLVLESLRGAPVSGVRLAVGAGRAPVAATVRVSGEGPFSEVVRLSGHLVRGGGGVVLERVILGPAPAGVSFTIEGFSLTGVRP